MSRAPVKRVKLIIALVILAALCVAAFYQGLTLRRYKIYSSGIEGTVKIVVLSDLHSVIFGKAQEKLIDLIIAQEPDLIMLTGDIADDKTPFKGTELLLNGIRGVAPIFYVSGNHEYWTSSFDEVIQSIAGHADEDVTDEYRYQVKEQIEQTYNDISDGGVRILSDEYVRVNIKGNDIIVAGVEDPARKSYYDIDYDWHSSIREAFSELDELDGYKILLAHRPELIESYKQYDFSLVLSGHAHGGQVRIPFILNGLFAPGEGFFPKYAGGLYEHGELTHIVSRGLVYRAMPPRIFNPPELVVIELSDSPAK